MASCKYCNAPIRWHRFTNGNYSPVNPNTDERHECYKEEDGFGKY
jgi:hypothetical protein